MELLFESTKSFEKELSKFQAKDKKSIIKKINMYCSLLGNEDKSEFYKNTSQPFKAMLKQNDSSTLYVLRVGHDIRVVLTVDDDPIFNQIIITLMRVIRHSDMDKAYKGVMESLYQEKLNSNFGDI